MLTSAAVTLALGPTLIELLRPWAVTFCSCQVPAFTFKAAPELSVALCKLTLTATVPSVGAWVVEPKCRAVTLLLAEVELTFKSVTVPSVEPMLLLTWILPACRLIALLWPVA